MHKMNQLDDWFLHLTQLIGVKQPEKYHPEGDVWNHTMQVLDSAALLRSKAENPLGFMLTAVVHDFGKIISTTEENGEIHSYDHAKADSLCEKSCITSYETLRACQRASREKGNKSDV